MTTLPRKIAATADVTIPPIRGDETERKWRGVLYESGAYEYYTGDELFDWDGVDEKEVPEPVKICIEFLLAWRALDEPDELDTSRLGD